MQSYLDFLNPLLNDKEEMIRLASFQSLKDMSSYSFLKFFMPLPGCLM